MFAISPDLITSTARKVTSTYGFEGDGSESLGTAFSCRFREITRSSETDPLIEQADAMLWCDSTISLSENDILEVDAGQRYRIIRLTKARGAGSTIKFLKCDLERYRNAS